LIPDFDMDLINKDLDFLCKDSNTSLVVTSRRESQYSELNGHFGD